MLFSITSVAYGLWLSLRDALCFFSKCFSKALFLKPFVPKLTMLKKKEKHHLCYLSSFLAFSCICAFFFSTDICESFRLPLLVPGPHRGSTKHWPSLLCEALCRRTTPTLCKDNSGWLL